MRPWSNAWTELEACGLTTRAALYAVARPAILWPRANDRHRETDDEMAIILLVLAATPPSTPGTMEDAIVNQTEAGKRLMESSGWYRISTRMRFSALHARGQCVMPGPLARGWWQYWRGLRNYRAAAESHREGKRFWELGNDQFALQSWQSAVWFYLQAIISLGAAEDQFRDAHGWFQLSRETWYSGWPAGGP